MLPCLMFSSQSSQSPSPSPGFSPSVGFSVSASSSFSSFCSGGSSDPRLSPTRRPSCQHDNRCANSSPALPPVTNHQSQVTISFIIRTSEKLASNPFRIRTSKTQDLKPFRMNTYKKTPQGGAGRENIPGECKLGRGQNSHAAPRRRRTPLHGLTPLCWKHAVKKKEGIQPPARNSSSASPDRPRLSSHKTQLRRSSNYVCLYASCAECRRCVFKKQRAGRMRCARFENTRGAQLSLKRSPAHLPTNYPHDRHLERTAPPLVRTEAFDLGWD